MIGFIPLPRVLVLCEMQLVSARIWTRVAVSTFCDDNHYTTSTSKPSHIYVIHMYKEDLALNILQCFICHRTITPRAPRRVDMPLKFTREPVVRPNCTWGLEYTDWIPCWKVNALKYVLSIILIAFWFWGSTAENLANVQWLFCSYCFLAHPNLRLLLLKEFHLLIRFNWKKLILKKITWNHITMFK